MRGQGVFSETTPHPDEPAPYGAGEEGSHEILRHFLPAGRQAFLRMSPSNVKFPEGSKYL